MLLLETTILTISKFRIFQTGKYSLQVKFSGRLHVYIATLKDPYNMSVSIFHWTGKNVHIQNICKPDSGVNQDKD